MYKQHEEIYLSLCSVKLLIKLDFVKLKKIFKFIEEKKFINNKCEKSSRSINRIPNCINIEKKVEISKNNLELENCYSKISLVDWNWNDLFHAMIIKSSTLDVHEPITILSYMTYCLIRELYLKRVVNIKEVDEKEKICSLFTYLETEKPNSDWVKYEDIILEGRTVVCDNNEKSDNIRGDLQIKFPLFYIKSFLPLSHMLHSLSPSLIYLICSLIIIKLFKINTSKSFVSFTKNLIDDVIVCESIMFLSLIRYNSELSLTRYEIVKNGVYKEMVGQILNKIRIKVEIVNMLIEEDMKIIQRLKN
jgi:hypothetical protein